MKKRKQIKDFLEGQLTPDLIKMVSFQVIHPAIRTLATALNMGRRSSAHDAGRLVYKSIVSLVNYEG